MGIGQGYTHLNPLQLCVQVARLANRRKALHPRLIKSIGGVEQPAGSSFGDLPFEIPRILRFLPGADLLSPPDAVPERPQVMVTFDAASADRLGLLEARACRADELIVLDHHASNTRFGTVNLVDPAAAATAVLAFDLICRMGVEISRDIALGLYAGLVTDTGSFKYSTTSPRVHQLAARLLLR